jgi:hypothetical protein
MPIPVSLSLGPLVTLDDVKDHLDIDANDMSQDTRLQRFLDGATALIRDKVGAVVPESVTEWHRGGAGTILLVEFPVLSVETVTEYGRNWADQDDIENDGSIVLTQVATPDQSDGESYMVEVPKGTITRLNRFGRSIPFSNGTKAVQVSYTTGAASVPADIVLAILTDIEGLWRPSQNSGGSGAFDSPDTGGGWGTPVGLFPRLDAVLKASNRVWGVA